MQKLSNASDSQSNRRSDISLDLYVQGGASDAQKRFQINGRLGNFDLEETLVAKLNLLPGETVVDVGCGAGGHLARFTNRVGSKGKAVGVDISPDAVEFARKQGLIAEVCDAAEIPLPAASIDALTCNYAIYYHPNLNAVLKEWIRVLKPNGRIVVSGPAKDTNQELYAFHEAVSGIRCSDADEIALGYVENAVHQAIAEHNFTEISLHRYTNEIRFPDAATFYEYWESTSLYLRTMSNTGESQIQNIQPPTVVTKKIAILCAKKP